MTNRKSISVFEQKIKQEGTSVELCNLGRGGEIYRFLDKNGKPFAFIAVEDLFDENGNRFAH